MTPRFLAEGFVNGVRLPRSVKMTFLLLEGLKMITSVLLLLSWRKLPPIQSLMSLRHSRTVRRESLDVSGRDNCESSALKVERQVVFSNYISRWEHL